MDVLPGVLGHLSFQAAIAVAQIHSRPHISVITGTAIEKPMSTSGCRQLVQDEAIRQLLRLQLSCPAGELLKHTKLWGITCRYLHKSCLEASFPGCCPASQSAA